MKKILSLALGGMLGLMSFGLVLPQATHAQVNGQPRTFGNAQLGQQAAAGITGVGDNNANLLDVVKNAINFVLGLLSFIALCVLLWGGFQMVTAAGDDGKYSAGFKILQQSGVGLLFIGVSWIFVQFMFFILGAVAG